MAHNTQTPQGATLLVIPFTHLAILAVMCLERVEMTGLIWHRRWRV
jgi:hypothetical protein